VQQEELIDRSLGKRVKWQNGPGSVVKHKRTPASLNAKLMAALILCNAQPTVLAQT